MNGELISRNYAPADILFNGIFSYENDFNFDTRLSTTIENTLRTYSKYVNHISFGKNYFMKFWKSRKPTPEYLKSHYSFYSMADLSFGYFISNLIEIANRRANGNDIPFVNRRMFYPIDGGKETQNLHHCEIEIESE